jgi:hypothetical protein
MPIAKTYSKELANLAKLYIDEAKYSNENNNFDFKLIIFIDLCQKANIPRQEFSQAYSTMLCGLALDHYYTNLKLYATTLKGQNISVISLFNRMRLNYGL